MTTLTVVCKGCSIKGFNNVIKMKLKPRWVKMGDVERFESDGLIDYGRHLIIVVAASWWQRLN